MSTITVPYEPPWSPVGPRGATVRVKQRGPSAKARLVFTHRSGNGYDEESLGYSLFDAEGDLDPERVEAAKREAARFSNLRLSGEADTVRDTPRTLGELADLFREDPAKGPDSMSEGRAHKVRRQLAALETFFGRDFPLADLAPSDWHRYHDARRRGLIDHAGQPVPEGKRTGVSNDTASKDLQVLRQLARWATRTRGEHGFLLAEDPTRGLELPWNEDPDRPIVTDELLAGLREAAPKVTVMVEQGTKEKDPVTEPTPLPTLIELANGTGRRINALLGLRWGDWDPEAATHGTLVFRGEFDKLGRTQQVPVLAGVRAALQQHRRDFPDILPDEAWVFPSPTEPGNRLDQSVAIRWLQEAEVAARGHHVPQFGFHAFRRRWVNRVGRDLPPAAAAKMGGWKDAHVMQTVYERLPALEEMDEVLARVEAAGGAG